MKKIVGGSAVCLGGLGFVLCLIAIVSLWSLSDEIREKTISLFDSAERGLVVTGVSLNRMVPQLLWMQDEYGRHLDDVALEEVAVTFHELQALVDASAANTDTAVAAVELLPFYLWMELNRDEWETAVSDLDEMTVTLDLLAELSIISKEEDTIATNLVAIDKHYTQLIEQVKHIIPQISSIRKVVFEAKENLSYWVSLGSTFITILLIWMGLGQVALVKWGVNIVLLQRTDNV